MSKTVNYVGVTGNTSGVKKKIQEHVKNTIFIGEGP